MTNINYDQIRNANPKENLLCEMIEGQNLNVLVTGNIEDIRDYKELLEAMRLYGIRFGRAFKFRFLGEFHTNDVLAKVIECYGLQESIEFMCCDDIDYILTCYMGSNAIIHMGQASDDIGFAREFYIPVIVLKHDSETLLNNGILSIDDKGETIAAVLSIIKDRKYSREFTGYKKIY